MIIHTPLVISAVAVTTIATMVFVGLGHLPKPTRATAIWSAAFTTAMAGSFIWLGGDSIASVPLRGVANGLIFGSMLLVWSGVRSYRGISSKLAISIPLMLLMSLALFAAAFTDYYGISFRVVTAVIAVFAALSIVEFLRLGSNVGDEITPFIAVGALYIVFAFISLIDAILVASGERSSVDGLSFIRGINMVGVNVMVLCTLVTVLLLATRDETIRTSASHDVFESVAGDRLHRAKTSCDPWWSFLDIRLDDPDDIRVASSTAMFNDVCERFYQEVYVALPADADIHRMSPTRVVALVPRAQGGMREILKGLLQHISAAETNEAIPVRVSASIGWAHAPTANYNFDDLLKITADAARAAQAAGGGRWERVHGDS